MLWAQRLEIYYGVRVVTGLTPAVCSSFLSPLLAPLPTSWRGDEGQGLLCSFYNRKAIATRRKRERESRAVYGQSDLLLSIEEFEIDSNQLRPGY